MASFNISAVSVRNDECCSSPSNTDMDNRDVITVCSKIVSLCRDITNTSLQTVTLQTAESSTGLGCEKHDQARKDELETKSWLNGQLMDYQSVLWRQRNGKKRTLHRDDSKDGRRRIKLLKAELFDVTIAHQQLLLLSDRLRMSTAMRLTVFPNACYESEETQKIVRGVLGDVEGGSNSNNVENDEKQLFVTRQALNEREEMVSRVLEKCETVDRLKDKLREVIGKGDEIRSEIIQILKKSPKFNDIPAYPSSSLQQINLENKLLKECLLGCIPNFKNWYDRDVLRQMLPILEELNF